MTDIYRTNICLGLEKYDQTDMTDIFITRTI